MEPRRIVRCEECGTPVRAYGMGAHRKMHGREAIARASAAQGVLAL